MVLLAPYTWRMAVSGREACMMSSWQHSRRVCLSMQMSMMVTRLAWAWEPYAFTKASESQRPTLSFLARMRI